MNTYKYANEANTVVHIIDEDGISRSSCLVSALPEGVTVLPADLTSAAIPTVVIMRQARHALLQAGLLDQVNTTVAAMVGMAGAAARIEWEFSPTVDRGSPLVQSLAATLGLTEAQLDYLFSTAVTL